MTTQLRRITAFACSLLLAAAPVQTAIAETANPAKLADALDATADALDKIVAAAPASDYDPAALAAAIDGDADALTAWVAENIARDLYRGSLKGAQGALEDRRGNSLDRALLLAALVAAKGSQVRLAHATLSADAATKLVAAIGTQAYAPAPALDAAVTDPILAELIADPRVNGAALKAGVDGADTTAASATAASDGLHAKVAGALTDLVGARLPGAPSDADIAALAADHWWVQVEEAGAWRDLDPDAALIGAVAASETMNADALPETERHRVTLRVVAESAPQGGVLTTTKLLERSYDTAAVNGRILVLSTQPLDAPGFDALAATSDDIAEGYRAGTAWLPVLVIDGPDVQSFVKADGSVVEATDANIQRLTGAAAAFDTSSSGLDQIGTGEEEAPPPPAGGLFTAAWIEFEITAPGASTRIERRVIFDAIGAEARASGSYVGDLTEMALAARGQALRDVYSIVIQGGALAPARVAARFAGSVSMARRAVAAWLRGGVAESGPDYPEVFRQPQLELDAWSLGRGDAALAATNIALLRDTASFGENGYTSVQVFDIVANPVSGKDGAARLSAGVADTVLEHQLMGAPETSVNTAVTFAADLDAGQAWGVVMPGDQPALDALSLAPEAAALIAADLARGAIVVARPGATLAEATWWRIDPATGETVGMTAAGGSETAEYIIAGSIWITVFGALVKMRCERSGGRKPGTSYAECAAASYGNPFAKAGKAVKDKIKGAIDSASNDALKDI